jgi:hypothetical protein
MKPTICPSRAHATLAAISGPNVTYPRQIEPKYQDRSDYRRN